MIHSIFNLDLDSPTPGGHKEIILGAGCFWGVERRLWNLQGVRLTSVGYAGGSSINPSYEEVCSGGTGHAVMSDQRSQQPHGHRSSVDLARNPIYLSVCLCRQRPTPEGTLLGNWGDCRWHLLRGGTAGRDQRRRLISRNTEGSPPSPCPQQFVHSPAGFHCHEMRDRSTDHSDL